MAPFGPLWRPFWGTQWDLLEAMCLSAAKFFFGAILKTKSQKSHKKFSGNFQNEMNPSKEKLNRVLKASAEEHKNNLHIIATYLFDNPGARLTEITQHLCDVKGRRWTRGHYIRYFSNGRHMTGRRYADLLWRKTPDDSGWMLTIEGYGYVRK